MRSPPLFRECLVAAAMVPRLRVGSVQGPLRRCDGVCQVTGFGGLMGLTTNPPIAGCGQFAGRAVFSGMVTPVWVRAAPRWSAMMSLAVPGVPSARV